MALSKDSDPCILFVPHFETNGEPDEAISSELSPVEDSGCRTEPARYADSTRCNHYIPSFDKASTTTDAADQIINTLIDKGWQDEKAVYQILPKMSSKSIPWPVSTDVHCWWCCFPFTTRPIPLATNYSKGNFKVLGNFCSFNCAKTYLLKTYKDINLISLNVFLYRQMTGRKEYTEIIPAPPRESLKIFGGPLTIDDFRKASLDLKEYKTYPFNCISVNEHIEESVRLVVRSVADDVSTSKSSKRKHTESTEISSTKDLDLRARMEDAKARLDTRNPTKKRGVNVRKTKTRTSQATATLDDSAVASESPGDTRTGVAVLNNSEPIVVDAATIPGASEYILKGMMGLKIVRREKKRNKQQG